LIQYKIKYNFLQDVEDYSNTPVVTFLAILLLIKDLRSNIAWSAAGCLCHGIIADVSGQTEVRDLNDGFGRVFRRE
jgi:hypothetical protein